MAHTWSPLATINHEPSKGTVSINPAETKADLTPEAHLEAVRQRDFGGFGRDLAGKGTIWSYTVMYSVPGGFDDQKPYAVALVRLDDGPMVTAQLTDVNNDSISIGMRVEMVTRKLREDGDEGQIIYGYKFRPLLRPE
jgi:hypothetical protein